MELITANFMKLILLLIIVFIANRWASGSLDKPIRMANGFKKRYGIFTMLFVLAWFFMVPTGTPDDLISIWIIAKHGIIPYLAVFLVITLYLIWRLKVTFVIYKK